MPDITWDDIGDIKHRIRRSLTKAVKIELMAKEAAKVETMARELREEIQEEVNKLDDIINKEGRKDEKISTIYRVPIRT